MCYPLFFNSIDALGSIATFIMVVIVYRTFIQEKRKYHQTRNYDLLINQIKKLKCSIDMINEPTILQSVYKTIEDSKSQTIGDLGQDLDEADFASKKNEKKRNQLTQRAYQNAHRILTSYFKSSAELKDFTYSIWLGESIITQLNSKEFQLKKEEKTYIEYEMSYIFEPLFNALTTITQEYKNQQFLVGFSDDEYNKIEFFQKILKVHVFLSETLDPFYEK